MSGKTRRFEYFTAHSLRYGDCRPDIVKQQIQKCRARDTAKKPGRKRKEA